MSSDAARPPIDSDSWCRVGKTQEVKHTFTMTVENFSEEMAKSTFGEDNCVESNEFSFVGPDDSLTRWKLIIYPNGKHEADSSVGIYLRNNSRSEVKLMFSFNALDVNSELKVLRKKGSLHAVPSGVKIGIASDSNRLLSHANLEGPNNTLLPQDSLTIVSNMILKGSRKTSISGQKKCPEYPVNSKPNENFMSDLKFAFNNKDFADVKIVCEDRVFDCHRIILSSRSSVFRAMFQHNMAEAQTRRVEIQEIPSSIVHAMLEYIYTGRTIFRNGRNEDMLAAAEMYDLKNLKARCEENLSKSLEIGNCIDYLILGDTHNSPNLKRQSMKLIVLNLNSVVKSRDWQEKLIRHPMLVTEVMKCVVEGSEPPKKRARTEESQPVASSRLNFNPLSVL